MQEIHLLNANQLFTTAPNTTIDRRVRQSHLQNQALKCPRCDSLNTKFCYYNNYNHSQPRHFCKSCRRYWTKGGVLRNVPVGGGYRKSSSKRPSASAVKETKFSDEPVRLSSKPKSNNSNSSSETTSSLTGSGGIPAAEITPEISPSAVTPPNTDSVFGNYVFPQVRNINFSSDLMIAAVRDGDTGGFAGRFSNINDIETTTYDYNAKAYDTVSVYQQNEFDCPYEQWQLNTEQVAGDGCLDLTAPIDQGANIESEPLNWHQGQQQQYMFAVDEGYWSHRQWNSDNAHLYLP